MRVPAAAKPTSLDYEGATEGGESIAFALSGKHISDIEGYILPPARNTSPMRGT
jgi:hypothetical protein